MKARKVFTPGSHPNTGKKRDKDKRGRPKRVRVGTARKGNYRSKYNLETFDAAIKAIENGLSVREAERTFKVET